MAVECKFSVISHSEAILQMERHGNDFFEPGNDYYFAGCRNPYVSGRFKYRYREFASYLDSEGSKSESVLKFIEFVDAVFGRTDEGSPLNSISELEIESEVIDYFGCCFYRPNAIELIQPIVQVISPLEIAFHYTGHYNSKVFQNALHSQRSKKWPKLGALFSLEGFPEFGIGNTNYEHNIGYFHDCMVEFFELWLDVDSTFESVVYTQG